MGRIDGDHHYEGVRQDFDTYALMVRKGGLIAVPDIIEGKPEVVGGMPQLWDEVKSQYRYSEIIDDTFQAVFGDLPPLRGLAASAGSGKTESTHHTCGDGHL